MSQSLDITTEDVLTFPSLSRQMLNKVPAVTAFFWIIKVLATTVGETAADFLNEQLNFGLTKTTVVMSALLLMVLFFQFRAKKYVPAVYWLAVVLISIVGTLITDNLVDHFKVPLQTTTLVFGIALTATFAVWYASEKTLSIHSIFTTKREAFYWLTILFTFALGTAAGDLVAETLSLGYPLSALIFAAVIGAIAVANRFGLNSVLAFWAAYILTRPLGASIGDYLSQPSDLGGLGLGTIGTSALFLLTILGMVSYLSLTRKDVITVRSPEGQTNAKRSTVVWQVVVFVAVLAIVSGVGFSWRSRQLANQAAANSSATAPLGDLSTFRKITTDTLGLVRTNDVSQAKARVTDLETAWDNSQARLKPMNPDKWSTLDSAIDAVLKTLRTPQPDAAACSAALQSLIDVLNTLDPHA
jgi:uncharacterized membrane-anchored protein